MRGCIARVWSGALTFNSIARTTRSELLRALHSMPPATNCISTRRPASTSANGTMRTIRMSVSLKRQLQRASSSTHMWSSDSKPASLDRYRSEEHTSELQSHLNLVCRLLLEKKKKNRINKPHQIDTRYYTA